MATNNAVMGQSTPQKRKQSVMGIISFVISLLDGLGALAMLILTIVEKSEGHNLNSSGATVYTIIFIAIGLVLLLALGLAIGSIFSKGRSKIFAILALVLQAGIVILSVITLAMAFIRS